MGASSMSRSAFHLLICFAVLASLLSGCVKAQPAVQTAEPSSSKTAPPVAPSSAATLSSFPTPTPFSTLTLEPVNHLPAPSITPTAEPTTLITPFIQGPSLGLDNWSPDSHWLPYEDFSDLNAQTLHFYTPYGATICDFPDPIHNPNPDRFLAWLPDGRVVVQAAERVLTGLPCEEFKPATAAEIRILDQTHPSYSPGGRYQLSELHYQGSRKDANDVIAIRDVATGKALGATAFLSLPRGGGTLPGGWIDADHFLIPFAGGGPLLLSPGKPGSSHALATNVATDIFHQPSKPDSGTFDEWTAIDIKASGASAFHLMLIRAASQPVDNPLQIYHSETGQVETLPYLASQGHFSNDGHWLLVDQANSPTLIRHIDPPGSPFQTFADRSSGIYRWSPDGSEVFGMSDQADQQSVIWLYSSPQKTYLTGWQAPGYELFPFWSPDGKYLASIARLYKDYNQSAIFVIPVPAAEPATPSAAQAASPTVVSQSTLEVTPTRTEEPGKDGSTYCVQLATSYHAPEGYQTYCDPDFRFAFDYPKGWRITDLEAIPDTATSSPLLARRIQTFAATGLSNYIRTYAYHLYGNMSLPERVQNDFSYPDREFPENSYPSLMIDGSRAYAIINRWHQDDWKIARSL